MLIGAFVVLLLRDLLPGVPFCAHGLSRSGVALLVPGSLALCWIGAHVGMLLSGRRCDRSGSHAALRWAEWSNRLGQIAGFGVYVGGVLCLDWLGTVRTGVGDLVMLDEFLAASPFLLLVLLLAWSHYPIERRVREALIIRALDTGQPIFRIPSRAEYLASVARLSLALVVVPVVFVLAWAEAMAMYGQPALAALGLEPTRSTLGVLIPSLQLAGVLVLLLLMPLALRYVLHARSLGSGPLRDRIEALYRRHRIRVRDTLEWRTHGLMVNAAVLGVVGPMRFMLFTDALLAALTQEQIEAVAAHEIAHARRRHLPWMMAMLVSCIVLIAGVVDLVAARLPAESDAGDLAVGAAGLGAAVAAFVLFGFVSRRFEWEADAFAVRHLAEAGQADGASARITPEAVTAMTGALREVAAWNHIPLRAPSWRHGSIFHRRRLLQNLVGTPTGALPIDRIARRIRAMIMAGVVAAGGTLGYQLRAADRPGDAQEARMRFTKMHGCGNDFVIIDGLSAQPPDGDDLPRLVRRMAHRTEGVGFDQALVLGPASRPDASVRMRVFNADGSEAGICGNGVRCVARYVVERHGLDPSRILLDTGSGVRELSCRYDSAGFVSATADMGAPELSLERIPVARSGLSSIGPEHEHTLAAAGREWRAAFVGTGNPHAVLFPAEDAASLDLEVLGPAVERHPAFPERTNVQFVWAPAPARLVLRTWERGTGVTRACGTGACAAVVAGVLTGRTDARARVEMVGGALEVGWDRESGRVTQTGPASFVFDGEWNG